MSKPNNSIWFWQRMVTPHMAVLAAALAERGFKVNYVANENLSKERIHQGWKMPELGKVKLLLAPNKDTVIRYALNAPKDSIHLCQGLRGNGLVSYAQRVIRKRNLRHWAMMETVDDTGWTGFIRKILYRILFLYWRNHLTGVLAIGQNTLDWFVARGMERNRVYPFAYFLKKPSISNLSSPSIKKNMKRPFRFIFVGQLINRKRVDLLIKAIATLKLKEIEFWIVGNGSEEKRLRSLANILLPKKVFWLGVLPIKKIPNVIHQADCLVLPSRFDGWGAVVSEALMVGTPVVCSDKSGSSVIVEASGVGSIFVANNQKSLITSLRTQLKIGQVSLKERQKIMKWSRCLSASSGAKYLELILNLKNNKVNLIKLPWN
jgi:glycosyltransferase involved in cell wall biosynthesis|tara:strand:+ start:515 stop:1642 length:1128 start_codon:yes stop_codon:yes gene_type:complete